MAEEPLRGFGERIIKRARLPVSVLLALPFIVFGGEYFFYLIEHGSVLTGAIEQLKKDFGWFVSLASLPTIFLAFSRELRVHEILDRLLGVRDAVDSRIRDLLQTLAGNSGYDHPERIGSAPIKAREWFYSFANEQPVLRAYAFEIWEAYYVGLYISLASGVSFVVLTCLAIFVFHDMLAWSFVALCAFLFLAEWAVRHWSTVPTLKRLPGQQVGEIRPSSEILNEAKRRFG